MQLVWQGPRVDLPPERKGRFSREIAWIALSSWDKACHVLQFPTGKEFRLTDQFTEKTHEILGALKESKERGARVISGRGETRIGPEVAAVLIGFDEMYTPGPVTFGEMERRANLYAMQALCDLAEYKRIYPEVFVPPEYQSDVQADIYARTKSIDAHALVLSAQECTTRAREIITRLYGLVEIAQYGEKLKALYEENSEHLLKAQQLSTGAQAHRNTRIAELAPHILKMYPLVESGMSFNSAAINVAKLVNFDTTKARKRFVERLRKAYPKYVEEVMASGETAESPETG